MFHLDKRFIDALCCSLSNEDAINDYIISSYYREYSFWFKFKPMKTFKIAGNVFFKSKPILYMLGLVLLLLLIVLFLIKIFNKVNFKGSEKYFLGDISIINPQSLMLDGCNEIVPGKMYSILSFSEKIRCLLYLPTIYFYVVKRLGVRSSFLIVDLYFFLPFAYYFFFNIPKNSKVITSHHYDRYATFLSMISNIDLVIIQHGALDVEFELNEKLNANVTSVYCFSGSETIWKEKYLKDPSLVDFFNIERRLSFKCKRKDCYLLISNPFYKDREVELLMELKRRGYSVVYKMHPKYNYSDVEDVLIIHSIEFIVDYNIDAKAIIYTSSTLADDYRSMGFHMIEFDAALDFLR